MTKFCFSCIESRINTPKNIYANYKIGPFEKNQTVTIANNLRRALLSEVPGVAITAVKIQGVSHEYTSVPGVRELVLDLLMNIKSISLISGFELSSPCVAYLHAQGPGVIKANSIKFPSFIKCVDPDQHIATLAFDGTLTITFLICPGKNYWMQFSPDQLFNYCSSVLENPLEVERPELIKNQQNVRLFFTQEDANILPIDAVFMPVKRVNYTIEVDDEIDTEKPMEHIFLQIWTNGSIHPRQAISIAAKSLVQLFETFENNLQFLSYFPGAPFFINKNAYYRVNKEDNFSAQKTPFGANPNLDLDIGNLDLSLRPYSCLKLANIETVFDLLKYSREELLLLKNFGKRSLEEVESCLFQMGLELPIKKSKRTK